MRGSPCERGVGGEEWVVDLVRDPLGECQSGADGAETKRTSSIALVFCLRLILADVLHSSTSLATTVSSSMGEGFRVGERWGDLYSDAAGTGLYIRCWEARCALRCSLQSRIIGAMCGS